MREEHGREGAGCDDNTSALAGHLSGRRSSAGCGGRRCCSNVLRKLPSFVWDHPTQLQLREFTYTKTAGKSHIHEKCTRILLRMAGHRSANFQEDLEILQLKKKWRTPPGGSSTSDRITDGHHRVNFWGPNYTTSTPLFYFVLESLTHQNCAE